MANDFPERDALFPKISTAVILCCSLLVLAVKFLPPEISETIESTDNLFDTDEVADEAISESETEPKKRHLLIGITGLYLIVGYLIGLLWATPLFVFAYSWVVDQSLRVTGILIVLAFGIAYTFMSILNLSIDTGVISIGL